MLQLLISPLGRKYSLLSFISVSLFAVSAGVHILKELLEELKIQKQDYTVLEFYKGKYRPETTPYLETFHAVLFSQIYFVFSSYGNNRNM